jgi:adenylate kinase family enzyme
MTSSRFLPATQPGHPRLLHQRTAWLKGGGHRCLKPASAPRERARRIVLLETPGVRTGTQAEMLCEELGLCHLSVRELVDTARHCPPAKLTPAMQNALEDLSRGDSLPDETVLNLVGERLQCLQCAGGFVLEGFPRTVAQAKALEQLLETHGIALTAALSYMLPDEARIPTGQRFVHPLVEFYQQRGLLLTLNAGGTSEEICRQTMAAALLA